MNETRSWQVLLIGGASGVGKTHLSYPLARHFAVGLTEVDDFQVILEHMTTPEQQPVLHYWRTRREEARRMSDDQKLAYFQSYCAVMATALELVIANHLESGAAIVLEGDFILPSLATMERYGEIDAAGRVCGLFLYEEDEDQIRRNYLAREGEDQRDRAHASWQQSEWLRAECACLGIPAIAARPWHTVLGRAIAATQLMSTSAGRV